MALSVCRGHTLDGRAAGACSTPDCGFAINAIQHRDITPARLLEWLLIIAGTALSSYGLRYVWRWLLFGAAIDLSTTLRERLFHHFTQMFPQFYQTKRVGDLMAHATNDIQAVEQTAMEGILTLVDSITTGTVVIATMAVTISWQLTIVALLPMPVMAFATSRYGKLLHHRFDKAQAAFSDLNDLVQENLSGSRVVKEFGQEEIEIQEFVALSQDVVDKNYAVAKIDALFDPTIQIVVGERGVTLSGGQKQRISIARALLLDAEILILDDSLSAVDARTEAHILDSLRQERAGRTTLIASHRLSAIQHASLIIVLDDGRVAEQGAHAGLMQRDDLYAAMYRRQQLEELVAEGGLRA